MPRTAKVRYIVVVAADRPSLGSPRGAGDWTCFVGDDKHEVIERAIKARIAWGTRDYELWVGELSERVVIPTNFKLVKL